MFSSKIRKVLATVLVIAMTVTSAGFNTLAASVTRVTNVKSEVDTERQKGLSYKYYEQFKSESVRLLMNGDEADDSGTTLQGGGEKQDTPSVKNVDDASEKDDAGVGAKNSSTDDENKTTSDDSSSLNENKDDNKNDNKDDNKKDDKIDNVDDKGSTQNSGTTLDEQKEDTNDDISSPSDAEEGEGEDKSSEEEPEEDGQEKNKKSDDGNSEEETASTSETEKNDGGDADDETTATNSDVNEENNKFDLGEIIMQLGDGNLLGANGDGADQYIDSYLWDKIKNCGATEIYFLNESEWNSAPGTVQALDGSRLWWREDSNAVRTETSLQAIAHPGSIDHGGTVMWEFDSTGHALKVKVDGTKYYFGPKQKVNFHVSHWGTYYGKWDANAFKSSFAINSGNVTSVSYTGNAVYGLYAPSSASMKDFPNVKKMVLKELKLQDASGVGLFKDLTNLEELVLGSSIINSTNDLTELFSGCTKLKSVTLPSSIGNNITTIASMFKNCSALTSVTFGSVALSSMPVDATSMFEGCTSLTNINFGSVDLTKINNATKMFKNCSKLEKIWVNAVSCKVKDTATSDNMFENCQKLEGYNGTKFDSTKTNYEYAHVDLDAWPGYFTTDDNVVNDATVEMKIIMEKTSGVRVERTIKALKAYTYADFTSKYLNPIVKESGYEKVTKSYSEGFGKFICSDPNYSGDDIIVRFANIINNSKIDISDKTLGYNGYLTFLVYVNSSDITWILGSDVRWADGYVASKSYIRGKKFILPTDKDIIKEGYYLEGWLISDKDGNHDEIITEFELEEGDVKLVPEFRKGPMTLWFGTYPQNDATGAQQEPIKWRKINENGSEALYVAEDILDNVSFHTSDGEVTWADSNMHTWLNDTFKEKAFTNNQIDEAIINKTINTSGSVDTTDKVFVLSYDEANNYFADNSERIAEATNYAKNVDNGGDKLIVTDGKADWWLRTFGTSNGSINVVSSNGELDESGINPTYTKNGVRPALYLDLDSTLFRSYNNTITWNLGDELSWADSSTLWGEMTTYQGGQELPAQNNLATDRFLYGWKINDGEGVYKEIPENQTGNITLTPIFDTAPGTIWYGTYPQNDSTGKQIEPIKWRKLIENGGSEAVYVAENILDNVSYNKDNENTTWADSSIYSWLNDTSSAGFAGKAFTSNQLDNSLSIVKDKELVTSGSANINGKVNLLSLDDAQKLFKNDANRKASATAYAKAINNNGSVLTVNGGYSNWWLRSPGSEQMSNAAVIGFDGTINSNGSVVNASEIGVRPVLYVDITSETFKYDGNKVTWNLGSATWAAGSTLWGQMTNYQCGQALPKYNNLNIDKFLIGWKINNSTEVYKEIPNNQTGDITLTPVYGDAPDTLWLGLYPQNDVKGELLEPIKWRKLSQNGRSALYISDKVIDHVLYNDVNADVEWDTCTLHSWLNDSSATGFLGKTLTSIQFDDKTSILKPTELVTGQSIHTTDKVFLLNLDDTKNTDLFATKDDLKGMATEYTKAVKRNGKLIETSTSGYVRWWLRASYAYKNYSLYVTTNGGDSSGPAYYENQGLRPAINIDFESPLFRCTDNNLTWDLGDGMTWADRSTLWGEMTTYQGGQKLPTDDNLSVKYGYKLDGWFINGDRTATYSEIPSNQTGDITLTANWVAQNDENFATYKIKWELGAGANWVDGYKPITSYVSGWKTSLPTNADVVKNHYVLEGWYINDDVIVDTVIPSDQTGNITLKAKWTCDDYYVIPFKWYKNDLTGHEPTEVTAVHILRYPDIVPGPHGISASYEIEGSNGLMVYYTNTNEVYIYAPQDKPIYTPEDGRYLFGAGRGSSTVNSRFSSVTTITGLDLLDTSKTKDMAGMFYYMAKLKSIDISSFDTFNVTSMKKLFYRDYELESINFGTIHTKNVTDMESMFEDNNKLKTLDLKGFNTQKLTSMDYMFRNCNELTTIYATKNFVTTAITSTKTVFSGCSKLKGSDGTTYSDEHTDASYAWIDGLDEKPGYFYSDVNGEDCYILPRGWFSFDLAGRNPSQVKRIEIIKSQTPQINADILKKWDIPGSGGLTAYYTIDNVVYIYATNDYPIYTAKDSTSLFYPGGGAADSPSEGTFKNLEVIKGLDLLDTSRTTNMTYMFMDLQKITSLDLSSFDTSNVTSMNKMFGQCYALESIDLSNFDTSNVTTMSAMFEGDKELKVLDLRSFKTPNLTNMYSMFTSCEELTTIYVTKDFVTTALESTNNIFYGCSKLVGSNDTHYSEYHTDASYAWIDGLDGKPGYFSITVYTLPKTWITGTTEDSSGVTTDEMKAVTTLTISRYPEVAPANYDKTWDIVDSDGLKGYLKGDEAIVYAEESSVIYLPEDCGEFFTPATYDTSKNVFDKVKVINNLSLLKTKKVTNMSHMFANMNELESVDLSNFDTSNVTDMEYMFSGMKEVKTLNLGKFDTTNVTNMTSMFEGCASLEDILVTSGKFVTTAVTASTDMFKDCVELAGRFGTKYTNVIVTGEDHGFGNKDKEFARIDGGWASATPGYFCDVTKARVPAFWRNNKDTNYYGHPTWAYDDYLEGALGLAAGWYEELGFNLNKKDVTQIIISESTSIVQNGVTRVIDEVGATEVKYVPLYKGDTQISSYSFILKGTDLYVRSAGNVSGKDYYVVAFGTYLEDISGLFEGFEGVERIWYNGDSFEAAINGDRSDSGCDFGQYTRYARNVFKDCHKLKFTNLNFGQEVIDLEDMEGMFENCYELPDEVFKHFFRFMNKFNETHNKVKNLKNAFKNCHALTKLDLSKFDTSETTDMTSMFEGCEKLTSIFVDESKWSTSNVTASTNMFNGCTTLAGIRGTKYADFGNRDASFAVVDQGPSSSQKGYLSIIISKGNDKVYLRQNWYNSTFDKSLITDINFETGSIEAHDERFVLNATDGTYGYRKGTTIIIYADDTTHKVYGDGSWNSLFKDFTSLTSIDFENVDTSQVTDMSSLFESDTNLTSIKFTNFNTASVSDMSKMFKGVANVKVLNLATFNTNKVTNMTSMFEGCDKLEDILVDGTKFVTTNVTESSDMFKDCIKLTGRFGSRYTNVIVTGEDHGYGNRDVSFAHIDEGWASTNPGYFCDVTKARVPAFWRNSRNNNYYFHPTWTHPDTLDGSLSFAPGWYEEIGFTTDKKDITLIAVTNKDGIISKDNGQELISEEGATEIKDIPVYEGDVQVCTYSFILKGTELYLKDGKDKNGYHFGTYMLGTNIEDISGLFEGFESVEKIYDSGDSFEESISGGDRSYGALDIGQNTRYARNVFKDCHKLKFTNLNFGQEVIDLEDMEGMFENCYELPDEVFKHFFRFMNKFNETHNKVKNLKNAFKNCHALTKLDLSKFDTSETTDMTSMFEGCDKLEDILVDGTKFVTTNVTESSDMFKDCVKLTGRFGSRYTNVIVTGEDHGFGNRDVSFAHIDEGWASTNPGYFCDVTKPRVPAFWRNNKDRYNSENWNIIADGREGFLGFAPGWYEELGFTLAKENVTAIIMPPDEPTEENATEVKYVYEYLGNDQVATYSFILKGTELYVSDGLDANGSVYKNAFYFATNIEDVSGLFEGFTNLEKICDGSYDYYNLEIRSGTVIGLNTKYARNLFKDCNKLSFTNVGINRFATELIDVEGMFENCYALTSDTVNNFFRYMNSKEGKSTKLVNMKNMFKNCQSLTTLNLVKFDTSLTTDMTSMFEGCSNLFAIMVSDKFVTTSVTASENMFNGCTVLSGAEGTSYAEFGNRNAAFAIIDKGEAGRGYLSELLYVLKKGWYSVDKSQVQPFYVNKIRFASFSEVISSYETTWSVDDGLKAYTVSLGTTPARYEVVIKGDEDRKIYAPTDSSYLFSYLLDADGNKLEAYGFNNVTVIENIEYLDTRKVATASHMFDNMGNITSLDLSKNVWLSLRDTSYMFNDNVLLETLKLSNFDTKNVSNMEYMFNSCRKLTAIDVTNFDTANVENMKNMFYNVRAIKELDISNFNTEEVMDMSGMFYGIGRDYAGTDEHIELNLSNFNTSNVTNMASMFSEANVATLSLVSFDTSKVISMSGMFAMDRDLQSLTLGDSFDTSNVTNMSYMFYLCSKLDVLDVSKFNTSKVTNMASMFTSVQVETLDVSGFDTSNVTNISGMFSEVAAVGKLDLSNFNTSKVTDMSDLFRNCYIADDFELDLKSFDTSKVTNMNFMFAFSHRLTRIKVGSKFVTTNVNSSDYMFGELDNLRGSLGTTLASTSYIIDKTYARIDGGVAAPGYFSGDAYIVTFDAMDGYFPSKSVGENKETIATASVYVGTLIDSIKPENPVSNRGYEFVGWRVRGGAIQDGAYAFDYDATFEAIYDSDEKTKVRLNTGVGTFANGDNERITYMAEGDDTGRFERPVAEGYTFDEYYVNDEVLKATWSYASNDEVEVVAKYIPNNYRIIFNGNGATSGAMPMEIATYGETHILSKNQFENDGYDFGGWFFIDEDGQHNFIDEGEAYNLTSVKDGEIKLTAVWEPKRTVIHYESNGATVTLSDSEWNVLFGTEDSSENTPETMTEGDGLFGREYDTNMSPTNMFYNSQETLSPNRYYRPGYEFEGWALSPDTAAIYFDQSEIGRDENYQEDINLYAKWKPKKEIAAKLILDGNGGTINGAQRSEINLSYGEYLPQVTIENPGYELDYWENTYKIFGIITIRIRCEFPEFCDFFGERTLTAHWKPIKYTLRLNENFGDNEYYDIEATYGEEPDISLYTVYTGLKRTNARFTGWSTEQDSEGGIYLNTSSAYPSGVQKGGILNLYAIWNKPKYSIRLHGIDPSKPLEDDDNIHYQVFEYEKNEQLQGIKYTIATINNVKAEFIGWTYDPYLQNPDGQLYSDACIADRIYEDVLAKGVNFPLDYVNVKQIELWPKWTNKLNSSYIIFDGNGGTIEGSKIKTFTYTVGNMIQAPDVKDIYRKGYELDLTNPWVDKDGNVFTETTAKPDGEIHLYANWKQKTYDIEYVGIGDETILVSDPNANSIKKTMQGGEEFVVPDGDMFERPGYDFLGWDTKVAANTVVYKPGQTVDALGDADETVKLYTVWQPRVYTIYYYDGDDSLIGTNSFIFTKKVRVLPNEGITEGNQDAGFTYEVNGEVKKFSSGQSLNAEDFEIVAVEKEKILSDVAQRNNNLLGNVGGFFNNLFGDREDTVPAERKSPLLGDPGSGGGIVLKGNTAKQIYNLTFDANGGQFPDGETVKTATASTGDDMSAKWPPQPTNTTDFVGWAIELDDGTNIEYTDTTYTLTESITFKAKWASGYYARLLANGGVYSDGSIEQRIPMRKDEATNKFEIPTRTGYDFDNYYVRTVAGEEVLTANWNYFANEVTDVVAHWIPYNYRVVYDANGGTGYMAYEIATVGETYTFASNKFAKDGYRFDGWYVEVLGTTVNEGVDVSDLTLVKNGTVTVKATWAPLTYDVIYHANEGVGVMAPELDITYGVPHKLKANAFTKADHTFRGWSLATGSDITYFDKATISETTSYKPEINLYAEWLDNNEIYGTLKLHGNGGLINGSDDIVLPLRYLEPLSEPELEKTGYKFTNWTDNIGNVVTYPTECNFKELELTANWTPIKYNVRYFANGGTFTNGVKDFIDDNDKEYDDKFYLKSTTDISRVRYTFNGWKLTNATGERILGAGSEQENLTSIDGERVDLYAEWVGDTYTVTLHQIDPAGSALAADTVSNFTYGNNESLGYIANKIATVSDIGYEFSGWAVPTDRNRIKYFASQKADVVYETEGTNSIELYPVWVRRDKLVYVTFDGNGGTVNGANKWVVPFATGSELVYPISENVKRKGYNHTGWLDSDKTTPFNKTIVDFNENKTIYAEWAPGNYTIEYVAVGGNGVDDIIEGTMGSDTKTTAGKTTLTSNAYERIGYTFVGWDTNPDAKVAIYGDAEPDLEPLGDIGDVVRLYTVWKANEYTITYKDVAGNVIGTNVLTYGSTVTLLANTNIPIGQKDTGFELEGHPDVKFISGQTVTGIDLKIDKNTNLLTGLVLNGTTEKIVYIITFDANGGTFPDGRTVASSSITYGDPVAPKVPGNPTYGVKAFTGYTVDGAYRDVTTLTYNYTSSKTFFANWDGKLFKIEYAKNTPVSPDTTKVNTVTGATMATQSALANKNTRINPNSWNVVGYTFVGWATASYTAKVVEQMRDALDPRIIGDQGEINWDRAEGEVVTLYAMWARNKYRLTVAQNEDTTKSNIRDPFATSSYIYFDELLSDNAAFAPKTRTNYTFQNKWTDARIAEPYARKNYTGTNYYTTASVYRRTSDLLIYPLWTNDERVITLNLDPNEAELPSGYTKNTFVGYIDAPLNTLGASDEPKLQDGRLVTPIATPYDMKIFNYWSTTKGDSTTKVDPNKIYDGTFTTIYANVRFREEYALTYDPNGGTGFMAADTMKEGIKKDLQPNAYKKNGYVFGGWYDQYGAYHGNGTSIDNPSGPLYLSANWGKINNGGNGPSGGGGGGGGGGGRQAAGSIQSDLEDGFSMQTPILLNEYTWTKDAAGLPNGVLLKRSSTLAKALLNSSDHSSRYKIVAGDNDNIVLKNGFYSIQREDGSYFYLLDKDGNIKTGFVNVDKLILSNVNTNTYTIEKIGEADGGKYYLLEESSYKRGQLYNQPITLNGVKYLFDDSGRITSETAEGNAVAFTGSDKGWRYDPVNNTWSYYAIDNEGKVNTYRDGAYPIAAADNNTYYYVFDENGLMKTGFVEYNGNTYYLREEGALKGSVYTGTLTLNNKNYIFDASGAMVTALSHTEEVNTEENRFIP